MSKYTNLLDSVFCEWEGATGHICGTQFHNVSLFTAHVKDHVTAVDSNVCLWHGCEFTCVDLKEFTVHVLFHPYHSYLKLIGRELQDRLSLPPCRMGTEAMNSLPAQTVDLKCLWGPEDGACGREFESIGNFYEHVHEHTMTESSTECRWRDCDFTSPSRYKVFQHTRVHTKQKVVACPTCGALFANNTKFKDHLTRQLQPTDPALACSYCHKCFPSNRLLREHIRVHVNTLKCPHCDLTCNSPSRLLHHIRFRHMDSKPHNCPLCQKSFKTQHTLTVHIESHRQERYQCTVEGCGHVAKTHKAWQMHIKRSHTSHHLLYACHVCNTRFDTGNTLTSHLKNLHGFTLPPGHCRFRYIAGDDGLRRLQTVRLDDHNVITPELNTFAGDPSSEDLPGGEPVELPEEEPTKMAGEETRHSL